MAYTKYFISLIFLFWPPSIAQVAGAENPPVHIDLVAETFFLEKGEGRLALILNIAQGWKVYAPVEKEDTLSNSPEISWDGSENLKSTEITWPYSKKHVEHQEISHVYTKSVTVPIVFKTIRPFQPVLLKGKARLLACSTLCLPLDLPFSLKIDQSLRQEKTALRQEKTALRQEKTALRQEKTKKIIEEAHAEIKHAKEAVFLPFVLWLAFAGGILLNVMPCVLPVLGLKFFAFSTQKDLLPASLVRRNFLLTAFGIYTSFFILALCTILFKKLDETVGWGIHFQNPYFLIAMVIALSLFTANFWGFFQLRPPKWLGRFLDTTDLLDGGAAFFSGVLATLLATPCSAPFVGTAVGFALARNPLDIFLVFSCLGVGFSAPYLLVSILPLQKIRLPKAGPWMIRLQRFLGLFLGGTVLWLLFLLKPHENDLQFLATLALLSAAMGGLFLPLAYPWWGRALACLCFALLFVIPGVPHWFSDFPRLGGGSKKSSASLASSSTLRWRPLDTALIPELLKEGRTIFIDLTASWCLTCQINKRFVLQNKEVENYLHTKNIVTMRGDWSKPHEKIPLFLKKFGRAGIPFNVVISPLFPKGIVLPEILTVKNVLRALQESQTP